MTSSWNTAKGRQGPLEMESHIPGFSPFGTRRCVFTHPVLISDHFTDCQHQLPRPALTDSVFFPPCPDVKPGAGKGLSYELFSLPTRKAETRRQERGPSVCGSVRVTVPECVLGGESSLSALRSRPDRFTSSSLRRIPCPQLLQ